LESIFIIILINVLVFVGCMEPSLADSHQHVHPLRFFPHTCQHVDTLLFRQLCASDGGAQAFLGYLHGGRHNGQSGLYFAWPQLLNSYRRIRGYFRTWRGASGVAAQHEGSILPNTHTHAGLDSHSRKFCCPLFRVWYCMASTPWRAGFWGGGRMVFQT
jgi:hypothetical protein